MVLSVRVTGQCFVRLVVDEKIRSTSGEDHRFTIGREILLKKKKKLTDKF